MKHTGTMINIYYFSATGNSFWSAKKIAQLIKESSPFPDCELFNIGVLAQKKEIEIKADAVIFIFPSFAYGMPRVVRNFIRKADIKTSYCASFVTYGSSPRGTMGSLLKILKKKEIGKMYFGSIPAVENYLAIFGTPDEETIKRRCQMQEKETEEAARCIIERKENKVSEFYPLSFFIYCLFSLGIKIFYKFFRVSGECTGCAVCEKLCPVSAIKMKDGRPFFSSKCEHCQSCINNCPLRAIKFARVRFGTPGYRHPQIGISELMK